MIKECFFPDRDSMFSSLAAECSGLLTEAIEKNQTASMLVSGGGTPQPLYQQLSTEVLDWQSVRVALVDERWVDADQAGSNEAFIIANLLKSNAASAKFIAMKTADNTASEGLALCEQRYQQLSQPFDLTILGMGPDAHTASLFPNSQGLSEALDIDSGKLCAAIRATQSDVTGELTERMTLSLYGLVQSRQIHLLITGEEKLAVYKQALENNDVASSPISAVLQQNEVPVHVYWAP